jgi:hypothetical protein
MQENFLHFIWKNRLFNSHLSQTTQGEKIEIITTGTHNTDSGPDFFNAKVKIGNTLWAGNIEIHCKASDWNLHKHDQDEAYNNVILHVVDIYDKEIRINNKKVPSFVLNYSKEIKDNYLQLLDSERWISCEDQFQLMDPIHLKFWYSSLLIERLQEKTNEIKQRLLQNKNDWNETFYQFLAKNFGMKTNALPFEMLAKATPLKLLGKHKNNLTQIEALLFGQAGLLNEHLIGDDYFLQLRKEYSFLYSKYKLNPIAAHLWKFLRLRPVNFPTVRISQFANLIHKSNSIFSKILETESLVELQEYFKVSSSSYWDKHYRFNKESKQSTKKLGQSTFHNIVINTIAPILFVYGELNAKQFLKDRAIRFLEEVPAENNSIIRKWRELGIKTKTAFETQALLQLKNVYCKNKKCLNCQLGNKIIRQTNENTHESIDQ